MPPLAVLFSLFLGKPIAPRDEKVGKKTSDWSEVQRSGSAAPPGACHLREAAKRGAFMRSAFMRALQFFVAPPRQGCWRYRVPSKGLRTGRRGEQHLFKTTHTQPPESWDDRFSQVNSMLSRGLVLALCF